MTKALFSFLVLLVIPFIGFSQTQVSGNILSNTVWTKANSPYVLSGTVGVPAAYKLTIEPGVTIQRTADFQILVNGSVSVNGSQSDSITFSSGATITQSNKPFIEFRKSNLDNSSLRFVRFVNQSNNGNNIRIGDETEYSQTSPKNSGSLFIVRSNLSNGFTATKGYEAANSLKIDSCVFHSAYIIGYYPRSEKIIISNSTIISSTVVSDAYNYGITFTNCYLNNCTLPLGCCSASYAFLSTKVENCKIGDGNGSPVDGPINITNSIFYNTSINNPSARFDIKNSKFIVDKRIYNLDNSEISYLLRVGNLSVTNCELTNKSGNNYSGLYVSGNAGYNVGNTNTIANNTFYNLYDALYVNNFASINCNNNNFSAISRYHILNYSTKDFSALNNYYELKQGQTIDDVIYDANDDLTYGTVNYTPYSTSPVSSAAILPPKNVTKEAPGNGSVLVKWVAASQTQPGGTNASGGYKVYWGFINPFTYAHQITVAAGTFEVELTGASVSDSITVTALDSNATGSDDQMNGHESWYASATAVPVINTSGGANAYTFKPVAVDTAINVFYPDNIPLTGAKVSILPFHTGDILGFTNQNNITGTYTDSTGILTLTGAASNVNYQAALRSILFRSSSSTPDTSTRTVTFVVEDGNTLSKNKTKQITVGKDVNTEITDYFKSRSTGNWSDPEVWYSSPNTSTYYPATKSPDENANTITIQNGHTISVTSDIKTNQIIVGNGGALIIAEGVSLQVNK